MNSSPEPIAVQSYFSIYVFVAFSIIFMIIAGIVYYAPDIVNIDKEWLSNNVVYPLTNLFNTTKDWFTGKNKEQPVEDTTPYGPATITNNDSTASTAAPSAPTAQAASGTPDTFKQIWCLVGEDLTGKWCIQVPGDHVCDKDRSYPGKNDCEKS